MAHCSLKIALALVCAFVLAGCAETDLGPPARSGISTAAFAHAAPRSETWQSLEELPWPQGGQRTQQNYEEARRIFWKSLYQDGGTDLYCGVTFKADRSTSMLQPMSVEHVYPADAIAETEPGCTNRTCAAGRVQRAMADLQNLWPALQKVNSSRSRLRYGMLAQTIKPRFPEFCPAFRRGIGTAAVVEPRDEVKGDVARSIVYMHFVYGLPLEEAVNDRNLLLTWMANDPPDAEEIRRNALIAQIQGTANPLLDAAFSGM